MFSLEKFYDVVYENLLQPLCIDYMWFGRFGSNDPNDLSNHANPENYGKSYSKFAIAYDQEPVHSELVSKLWNSDLFTSDNNNFEKWKWIVGLHGLYPHNVKHFIPDFFLFANSEHSSEKNKFLSTLDNFHDWYYFYHGFAALDWFGNIPYRKPIKQYSKVFITFNNLYTENRSYRLSLIARLLDQGLDKYGYISMSQHNIVSKIRGEVFNHDTKLSHEDRKLIYHTLLPDPPKLVIDTDDHHGALSANDVLETMCQGLWHVVGETVYYDEKLHLTEKIFKPIVAKRPFILVGAPGNLAYLKSYGFQTFDRWIDESYDSEPDPVQRMDMVVAEVEKLCRLSPAELDTMYSEMTEVLEYNFNWMYGGFRKVIVDEMVNNFRRCVIQHNAGRDASMMNYMDHQHMDWADIRRRLTY
jgi:hypothetical protein